MVLQIILNDGSRTSTSVRRDVKRNELPRYRESFYQSSQWAKWGIMSQLKGKSEILLAEF